MIEFFLVSYLLSGFTKSILFSFGVNTFIDFTLLSIILLCLSIFIKRKNISFNFNNKGLMKSIIFFILFYIWIIISLSYTSSDNYSYQKTVLFITNIIAFCTPLIIKNISTNTITRVITYFIAVYSIIFIISSPEIPQFNLLPDIIDTKPLSGFYLGLGEIIGLNVLLLLCFERNYYFKVIFTLFFIYILILTSARGPIIFTFIATFICLLIKLYKVLKEIEFKIRIYRFKLNFYKTIIPILLIIILSNSFFIPLINAQVNRTLHRYEVSFSKGSKDNKSLISRENYFTFTKDKILQNTKSFVLGYGIGSFNFVNTGEDGRGYPHNIILEIWFELGLIGLLLFIFFVYNYLRIIYKDLLLLTVFMYIGMNLLKSSSLIDLRLFVGILSLVMFDVINKKTNNV